MLRACFGLIICRYLLCFVYWCFGILACFVCLCVCLLLLFADCLLVRVGVLVVPCLFLLFCVYLACGLWVCCSCCSVSFVLFLVCCLLVGLVSGVAFGVLLVYFGFCLVCLFVVSCFVWLAWLCLCFRLLLVSLAG